jgi:hypothetical protein
MSAYWAIVLYNTMILFSVGSDYLLWLGLVEGLTG